MGQFDFIWVLTSVAITLDLEVLNPKLFVALVTGILLSNISTSLGTPVRTKQSLYSVEKQKSLDNKDLRKELMKLNKFEDNYEETPCRGAASRPITTTITTSQPNTTTAKDYSYQEQDIMMGNEEIMNSTEKERRVKNASSCNNIPLINLDFSNSHISLPVNITCNNCTYLHY